MKLSFLFILALAMSFAVAQKQPSPTVEAQSSGECSPNILANQGRVEFTCNTTMDKETAKKFASLLSQLLRKEDNSATTVEEMNRKVDKLLYSVALLATPTPGNLRERALALSKKIFAQLDESEIRFSSQPLLDRARGETITFRWCCLGEVRAIRDEFAQSHFEDSKLDDILGRIQANAPNEIINHWDIEEIAKRLAVLAFPKQVGERGPPKALHFSETQVPQRDNYRFNFEITIYTQVPLSTGYIVLEYNRPIAQSQPEVGTGRFVERGDITDNKPLTDYLDRFPLAQTFVEKLLPNTTVTPDKPIHVLTHDTIEFKVTSVTWFDN